LLTRTKQTIVHAVKHVLALHLLISRVPTLQVNPDALPAPPGPQFKVQLNTAATVDAAAAAAAAAAAGTAGSGAAGALSAAASAASKASKPAAAGAKAGSSSNKGAAAAGAAPGTFYVEQASRSQPPLLQSLKPSAGETKCMPWCASFIDEGAYLVWPSGSFGGAGCYT
jgi:hypothetical protein